MLSIPVLVQIFGTIGFIAQKKPINI